MDLKENINYIKKEISAEESFMENFFKVEKFYKKNKTLIFTIVTLLVVSTIGYYVSNYISQQNKIEANKTFNLVLANPNDTIALETLKKQDQKLYNVALFLQNNTTKNEVEFLNELSSYAAAIKENKAEQIESVTQNQNFLLKDFAILNKAIIETQNKEYTKAKATLGNIPESSQLIVLSKMLSHFLLTK